MPRFSTRSQMSYEFVLQYSRCHHLVSYRVAGLFTWELCIDYIRKIAFCHANLHRFMYKNRVKHKMLTDFSRLCVRAKQNKTP